MRWLRLREAVPVMSDDKLRVLNYRDFSRKTLRPARNSAQPEDITVGSLQRIADALERIADNTTPPRASRFVERMRMRK